MSLNSLTTKLPLVAAAALGVFALSACSPDEMSSGQLASVLDDNADRPDTVCGEDLVLSDGEQVACDFRTSEESMKVTYSEDEHALLADNESNGIRMTIALDEEDNTTLADGPESVEYYPDTISAEELEAIADEHFNQQEGLLEEGEEPPEPSTIECDSDLDTSVTEAGDGPTCSVDTAEFDVLMESDTEIRFEGALTADNYRIYDLQTRRFTDTGDAAE